jgi:hypothetical protein
MGALRFGPQIGMCFADKSEDDRRPAEKNLSELCPQPIGSTAIYLMRSSHIRLRSRGPAEFIRPPMWTPKKRNRGNTKIAST